MVPTRLQVPGPLSRPVAVKASRLQQLLALLSLPSRLQVPAPQTLSLPWPWPWPVVAVPNHVLEGWGDLELAT